MTKISYKPDHTTPDHSGSEHPLPPARVRTRQHPPGGVPARATPEPRPGVLPPPPPPAEKPAYEVGYGKPPQHSRFKPGQSGNPKGRPKGAKGLNTLAIEMLGSKVAVRTAGGTKRISRIEAVMQKILELAMKGNPRALAELLKLYGNAVPEAKETTRAAAPSAEELTAADLAMLAAFRDELTNDGR